MNSLEKTVVMSSSVPLKTEGVRYSQMKLVLEANLQPLDENSDWKK